jgi:outer membrane protein OmpA-like peptidoglycan-associated protein
MTVRWFGLWAALLASLLLAGCSWVPDAVNPVSWYRDVSGASKDDNLEKGAGNQQNLEAGGKEPYPNLGDVPDEPSTATSTIDREALQRSLVADRINAQYTDEQLRADVAAPQIVLPAPPPPTPSATASAPAAALQREAALTPSAPPSEAPPAAAPSVPVRSSDLPAPGKPSPPPSAASPAASAPAPSAPVAPPPSSSATASTAAATPPAAPSPPSPQPPAPPQREAAASPSAPSASPPSPRPHTAPQREAAASPAESPLTSPAIPSVPAGETPAAVPPLPETPPPAAPSRSPMQTAMLTQGERRTVVAAKPLAAIQFSGNTAVLSERARTELSEIAAMQHKDGGGIRVIARAPETSDAAADEKLASFTLALNRAKAVADELHNEGVPEKSIAVEAVPSASGESGTEIFLERP